MSAYYNLDAPQGPSTLKQVAVVVPCFILGCVGALALTASPQNVVVQNNIVRAIPTQAATAIGATMAAAALANPAVAATPVDTFDYRGVREGYDIIYEARDLDLPQSTRDGLDQARDSSVAKARIAESARRLTSVGDSISKSYWPAGREELRRFVGTLRFDINTVAATSTPRQKKALLAAKKDLFETVDKLDFAMRSKDQTSAVKYHEQVVAKVAAISG